MVLDPRLGMSVNPPSLDQWVRVLSTYAGRDKAARIAYCLAILYADKQAAQFPDRANLWRGLAKQLSNCRLVLRQLNHPQMAMACRALYRDLKSGSLKGKDNLTDYALNQTVTVAYTFYGFVELVAWLADAKLLDKDAPTWFRYGLYLWLIALVAGITKSVRTIYRTGRDNPEKTKTELISLAGMCADFTTGVNSLPWQGFLWAGKLSTRTTASSTLLASVIALYKQFA